MGLRILLSLLAAAIVVVFALPAQADADTSAPRSTFTTQNNALLVKSHLVEGIDGKVEGDSVDDATIAGVLIRYCNSVFCQYRFEQNLCLPNCAAPQQLHWTFDIPPDGTWQVNVRAVDVAGNLEQPGPEITISVLPVALPDLGLPPLPILEQLPLPR